LNIRRNPVKTGTPDKPKHLSAEAAAEWDRLIAELQASGIQLTPAHRAPLETAATTAADMAEAREVIEAEGAYVTNEKTGALTAHPATRRVDALRRDLIKALGLLGIRSATSGGGNDTGPSLDDILKG
jgi:P27 family predicted phage terminase small subunit